MRLIEQYIIAMAHLYGAFTIEELLDLYNKHHEKSIDENTVYSGLGLETRLKERHVYHEERVFMHEAVYPPLYFMELIRQKSKHPMYIPEKEELLMYMNEEYFNPSDALDEWIRFIRRHGNEKALLHFDDVLVSSLTALKMGWGADETLGDLRTHGYQFEAKRDKEAIRILKDVERNLRRWEYNGHTLREIQSSGPANRKEVGRNAPCPCGSGKKYKHCCLNK